MSIEQMINFRLAAISVRAKPRAQFYVHFSVIPDGLIIKTEWKPK